MTKTMRCASCGTTLTEHAQALAPELRDVMPWYQPHVWPCPKCGCQNYDTEDDFDRHMRERVLAPYEEGTRLREQGEDVDVMLVDVAPHAKGFPIRCAGCNRTATVPFDPGTAIGMCPVCVRAGKHTS